MQDNTGGHVPEATVRIHRADNNSDRMVTTDSNGAYTTINLEPGVYDVTVQATGLASTTATGLTLQARQQLRYDVTLKVGSVNESVTVNATDAGVINLENAQISATLTPQAVLDLPANYRGAGSTSPLSVVQALPGVQAGQCELPRRLLQHTPRPRSVTPFRAACRPRRRPPSMASLPRTRPATTCRQMPFRRQSLSPKYGWMASITTRSHGQPGEITTVTKSGTNHVHMVPRISTIRTMRLDATPYGADASTKPQKDAKDFGGSIGLPVVIPRLVQRTRSHVFIWSL